MLPTLFSIGAVSVSSFGVFLALGFLVGIFLIWRLSRAWDLDEEKVLDLTLLTFLGGLAGARLYFVLENLPIFASNIFRVLLINKYPGFSFWGAILGGWLTLYFLAGKKRGDFWQFTDIAAVGFLASLILADIGCFLGSCDIGVKSNLFFAVNMVGFLGRRFPIQLVQAMLLFLVLLKLWSTAVRFHPRGKIVSLSLIYIGSIFFLLEPLKESHNKGQFLSLTLFIWGVYIFYKVTKRNIISEVRNLPQFIYKEYTLARLKKSWYNQTTVVWWKIKNLKKMLRRINVRFSYKNNKLY